VLVTPLTVQRYHPFPTEIIEPVAPDPVPEFAAVPTVPVDKLKAHQIESAALFTRKTMAVRSEAFANTENDVFEPTEIVAPVERIE
jgi:hypothetical protein